MFAGRRAPLALSLLVVAAACGSRGATDSDRDPSPESIAPPSFRLAIVTDPKGYLAPCGCTSRPLGGIDRMAALVRSLEAGGADLAVVAAGSLFFDGVDRGGEGEETDAWRAEALIEVWNAIGVDAAAPGRADLAYGAARLMKLASKARFPLLVANARVDDAAASKPWIRPRVVMTVGNTKLGLVGVADLELAPEESGALRFDTDPIASVREAVSSLRAEGAEVVIALASGDRALANRVADLDGVDFVVRGGLDQSETLPPSARGGAHLFHAARHGEGVLVLDVYRRGAGGFVDASPWTRRAAGAQREREARALEARISEWERDPSVHPRDLAEQRARLSAMRAEQERTAEVALPADGNAFIAEWHELDASAARDPGVASALERFDVRVNERNREAFAGLVPPPATPAAPSYVGSSACASCHAAAFAWWRGHPHGRAYATLVRRRKEFHLDCVGCHVTGYGRPGGSNVTHNLDGALVNVGCESCHGPGSLHVAEPNAAPRTIARAVPESTCITCHNDEHSDGFDYEAYRRRLMAPGHGGGAGS